MRDEYRVFWSQSYLMGYEEFCAKVYSVDDGDRHSEMEKAVTELGREFHLAFGSCPNLRGFENGMEEVKKVSQILGSFLQQCCGIMLVY